MLALSVPALAYLLQLSLASLRDFANIVALFHPEVIRGIAVCLLWMLAHHVLAGVRHSLFDIHVGTSLMLHESTVGQRLRSNWDCHDGDRGFPVKGRFRARAPG